MSTPQALIDQWRLHPSPEVGSCANQLAGWLRTQHSIESRLLALAARWREEYRVAIEHDKAHWFVRDTTTELGGKSIAADELRAELDAALAASRGGGDTRPPRQDEI